MFSRARRNSRAQSKHKIEISQDPLPTDSINLSTRSVSPALTSPLLPWADTDRPASSDGIGLRKSSLSTGPPILPPIRIASPHGLQEDNDTGSLHLDFTKSIPEIDKEVDNDRRKSVIRKQRSFEHFSRPRSLASPVPSTSKNTQLPAFRTASPGIGTSRHAETSIRTASPAVGSPQHAETSTIRTASPAMGSPRYAETSNRTLEASYPTASPTSMRPQDRASIRESASSSNNNQTTYITQDPMFPRSSIASPLVPKHPQSSISISSRDGLDDFSPPRTTSGDGSEHEHKRRSRRVGRAVSGPTAIAETPQMDESGVDLQALDLTGTLYDSPKMEASMFPTFKPPPPKRSPPIMDRNFIDSRDRPYSQAKPRPVNSPVAPNFTRPGYQASYSSNTSQMPAKSPGSTIGISFESTSAAFPAPQLVTTRPKTEGSISTVAGVQVPTHHTSGLKPQDTASTSSKSERRRTKLLNPMALLGRRKSAVETTVPEEEERKMLALAQARQKSVAAAGVQELPADFDPRIKGKIVHDFSAPRAPRREFSSPVSPYASDSLVSPISRLENSQFQQAHEVRQDRASQTRKSVYTPVFHEHLDHDPLPAQRSSTGGVGAENRENKDFLARFSQQSSASTFSQESAILPPFARRSQNLDLAQATAWRDDDGSWSSGRDSGARSSTGQHGDRESGISSFSAVSPIARHSDGNGAFYGFEAARGSLSPISPPLETKNEFIERPVSTANKLSTTSEMRPRTGSAGTARPTSIVPIEVENTHLTEATRAVFPSDIGDVTTGASQSQAQEAPVTPPRLVHKRASAVGHSKRIDEGIVQRKSNASRFSFQMGPTDGDEEKALEDKFRESGVFPSKASRSVRSADYDDDDYFDEDAMDDMDEMELQMQNESVTPKTFEPVTITIPTQQQHPHSLPSSVPTSATESREISGEGYYYSGDIPYVPNERELTYAEHPSFRTHSALADSRRESYQSTFLDSYLAGSPTSSSRKDDRSRQPSVTSTSPGPASGKDRSRQGSLQSVRGLPAQQISMMSPLPEQTESSTPVQTPKEERFSSAGQQTHVDSALGSFKFQEPVQSGRERADSDTEVKPQWGRTADLWKKYKKDEPSPPETAVPSRQQPSPHTTPSQPGAGKGVWVRRPSGSRQSRLSMASTRLASIKQQNEDIYFDDGQFEQDTTAPEGTRTDENSIDSMPVADRGQKDYSQQRAANLGLIGVASDGPYPSLPINEAARQRSSALLLHDLPLEEMDAQYDSSNAAKHANGEHSDDAPDLQAYHQALADAANRAEAEGRFFRQASLDHDVVMPTSKARASNLGPPPEAVSAAPLQIDTASPGQMGFDFGFNAPRDDDWSHDDDTNDDIVAAANAEALAHDAEGFYGSEFGFYANARPGAGTEIEAINGGFFGEDGDDGLTRKRSVKEPNLTPITERSEFSTRNSFINLHGLVNGTSASALSTPSLARMPVNAFSDHDITTFEQLKQLRKNAFGGSNGSLGSQQRSSPTSQHFPHGSVPMVPGHSTGSSSSGDRFFANDSPSQEHASHRVSLAHEPRSQSHSRQGSGTDTAVTYVRDQDNGHPRWIMEKRRTSGLGQVEVNREVVSDGWI